jgi:hypothetical protein
VLPMAMSTSCGGRSGKKEAADRPRATERLSTLAGT